MRLGKKFKKKLSAIQKEEDLSIKNFANSLGLPYHRVYDYLNREGSKPSIDNVGKVIESYPQYACYILDLDPKQLKNQIIPKEE